MKPAKLKRKVFRGWMDFDTELPRKTETIMFMRWGKKRCFVPPVVSEHFVKITVEWKEKQ